LIFSLTACESQQFPHSLIFNYLVPNRLVVAITRYSVVDRCPASPYYLNCLNHSNFTRHFLDYFANSKSQLPDTARLNGLRGGNRSVATRLINRITNILADATHSRTKKIHELHSKITALDAKLTAIEG
jgi:hypothetical protein